MLATTLEELKTWRRNIHSNPELSQEEYKTSSYIRDELSKMGLDYETPMDTATISVIDGNSDTSILLRADIDALPIKELVNVDYKSKNDGVMHACGHDAHASMLLATVKELIALRDEGLLKINVVIVFQPSEESFGGANVLVEKYDFKKHNIIASFSIHVSPDFDEGTIASKKGPIMASCNEFLVDINGKSSHVGLKYRGIDAINAALQVYQQFVTIPMYSLNSNNTNVLHIGILNAGEVMNSVPSTAHLEGTIRTYSSEDLSFTKKRMKEICEGLSLSTRCEINLNLREGYPAVLNDDSLINLSKLAAKKANIEFVEINESYLLGEDFSFFSEISPICFAFIGVRNEELDFTNGLHTPLFQLREEALVHGVDYFVEIVKGYCL
ncbi:M20 metallopeptidase family protein [Peptostreptococcus faecalis]|uniref:M20 metallopeptidase family protein n=1 Tax=Peptostreptococcus faecalis TaxID=2045015 RepID=UPI000C7CB37C|nr:M20 family metallopeptidase [Peptostreptococcus faecalis]